MRIRSSVFEKLTLTTTLVLGLAGCGSNTPSNPGGDGGNGGPDAIPGTTFSLTWGPIPVASGDEDTRCVELQLGNDTEIKVHQIQNHLSDVSHHLIVYRDLQATAVNTTPTPCQPFAGTLNPDGAATPIMITQRTDETLTLPDGVAYTFAPHQMIRLEMHYINNSDIDEPAGGATTTFTTIDPALVTDEADFLFTGDPDIDLLAGQTSTVGAYFKVPATLAGINIFAMTGHTHQFGTDVSVSTRPSITGDDTTVYHPDLFTWNEPETKFHDPPFQVPAGGGFNFHCDYTNTSDNEVKFGESANDEMCFFWAYYYPSKGAKVCFHTDQVNPTGGGVDLCCPDAGPQLCSYLDPNN